MGKQLTSRFLNDLRICCTPVFDALGLVPLQINRHHVDVDPPFMELTPTFGGARRPQSEAQVAPL